MFLAFFVWSASIAQYNILDRKCTSSHVALHIVVWMNLSSALVEMRTLSDWSPWLRVNKSRDGLYVTERFRCVCKASVDDVSRLRKPQIRTTRRHCRSADDNLCTTARTSSYPVCRLSYLTTSTDSFLIIITTPTLKRVVHSGTLTVHGLVFIHCTVWMRLQESWSRIFASLTKQ